MDQNIKIYIYAQWHAITAKSPHIINNCEARCLCTCRQIAARREQLHGKNSCTVRRQGCLAMASRMMATYTDVDRGSNLDLVTLKGDSLEA